MEIYKIDKLDALRRASKYVRKEATGLGKLKRTIYGLMVLSFVASVIALKNTADIFLQYAPEAVSGWTILKLMLGLLPLAYLVFSNFTVVLVNSCAFSLYRGHSFAALEPERVELTSNGLGFVYFECNGTFKLKGINKEFSLVWPEQHQAYRDWIPYSEIEKVEVNREFGLIRIFGNVRIDECDAETLTGKNTVNTDDEVSFFMTFSEPATQEKFIQSLRGKGVLIEDN